MLIWGSVGREVELASGKFHCPHCGSEQVYRHMRLARYFTLYFIPLFQTQNLGEYVQCQRCQQTFNEAVLDEHRHVRSQQRPSSLTVGDRVLAQWSTEPFFYPGAISAIENGRYQIQYDDGESGWVTAEQIAVFDIAVGDRVFARWQGGPGFYSGTIDEKDGERIHIRYDDGDQEWTTVRVVRLELRKRESTTDANTHFKPEGR